ncbi:MAG: cbb3-type cytochrome oxidase assembly protein CcoS [Flammeovirgaceae bacterium]
MEILLLLIGFSLTIALIFLASFLWAVKDGQFEDDFTPSIRILLEDEQPYTNGTECTTENT